MNTTAADWERIEARIMAYYRQQALLDIDKRINEWRNKPMKPGPYKSSTHGNIPLSLRGRELLMAERDETAGKISESIRTGRNAWVPGDQLSRARGELARYMSDLEYTVDRETGGVVTSRPKHAPHMYLEAVDLTTVAGVETTHWGDPSKRRVYIHYRDTRREASNFVVSQERAAEFEKNFRDVLAQCANPPAIRLHNSLPELVKWQPFDFELNTAESPKEKPVTDPKISEEAKTRSQLLADATNELCAAQRHLEHLQLAAEHRDEPPSVTVGTVAGYYLNQAVGLLVQEQWSALVKKAVSRAKSRVAKAEKAVNVLLK